MSPKLNSKNFKEKKGSVLVELVFVSVFFLLPILFGILEFGRIFYFYQKIVHQVQYVGRYLSIQVPGEKNKEAICLLLTGEIVDECENNITFINGITLDNINIVNIKGLDADGSAAAMNFVKVSVENYNYNILFFNFLNIQSFQFNPISATYRQVN